MSKLLKSPKIFVTRQLKNFNKNAFIEALNRVYWDDLLDVDDPTIMVQLWTRVFVGILDKHAPVLKSKGKNTYSPWVTSELIRKRRARDVLKTRAVEMSFEVLMQAYRNLRNQIDRENDLLKREYFSRKIYENDGNIKETWNTINKLIDRRSKTTEIPYLLHLLRDEITLLEKWMWDNKLTLNTLKTEFILISSIPKLREIEETCCIHIQRESIYWSPYNKSLGFYIDQHLDWEDHINHVIKKASAGIAILWATFRYLLMDALQTIYRSLVESHIRYGNVVWSSCGEVLLTKLQKIQNRAAGIVTSSEFDENAEPLIKELGWKTVRELVRYDTTITMHKSMHKIAPTYMSNIFQPLKDVHQIKLRDTSSNLRLPRVRTNMGLRSFSYQGGAVWNKLEAKEKMDTSLQSFKRLLNQAKS